MRNQRISRFLFAITSLLAGVHAATAQVTVNPTGVNVDGQGATTVFLTFSGVTDDLLPTEAFWCGELIDASPNIGLRCDPATMFGSLPIRFNFSRPSGSRNFTDIMSIPPSVARRAYQAAAGGQNAAFFYVRRFASRSGARDVFVAVTCRLTGGGAGVPFSLTDVRLAFAVDAPVLALEQGAAAPSFHADITYTGTGRLQGRWEIVLPGEELPTEQDLLAEAALPLEQRGLQRRFTELERFSVFLPPSGRVRLPGPDPARLPRQVNGTHLILLRIEAADDRDSQPNLAAAPPGTIPVASGAVAGFPMPTLRYVVGSGVMATASAAPRTITLLQPMENDSMDAARGAFTWAIVPLAVRYRLEIERADGTPVFDALVPGVIAAYRPPPVFAERAAGSPLRWRVRAENALGREIARSDWRRFTLAPR
jgi:hypothetical protein